MSAMHGAPTIDSPRTDAHVAAPPPGEARTLVAVVLGLVTLLTGMLALFAWPAARSAPHDLPIAVAGPPQIAQSLQAARPGAFEVTTVTDAAAAQAAVRERTAYGAIVVGADGAHVYTASAASPVVAQLLTAIATEMAAAQGTSPQVTDLVALPTDDPRGAGLAAGLLPIVLGGLACAGALSLAVRRRGTRIVGAAAFAIVGGLALTAVLQLWLGSLAGNYWANAAVLTLAIAAVSYAVLGLVNVLGLAGLGVGAAVMMLCGNALSGAASAPQLLPSGWGAFGQLLPPGAANQALRSVAFFDGHGAGGPLLVLGAWLVIGAVLLVLPSRHSVRADA